MPELKKKQPALYDEPTETFRVDDQTFATKSQLVDYCTAVLSEPTPTKLAALVQRLRMIDAARLRFR